LRGGTGSGTGQLFTLTGNVQEEEAELGSCTMPVSESGDGVTG
jgi:hypothetical protein